VTLKAADMANTDQKLSRNANPKVVKKAAKFKKTVGKNKQNQDPERINNTLSSGNPVDPDVPSKIEFEKTPLERQVSGLTEVSEDEWMECDEFEEGFYSAIEKIAEGDYIRERDFELMRLCFL
jgi:hypothetical protein